MKKTAVLLENIIVKNIVFNNHYACAPFDTSSGLKPAPLFKGDAFFREMFRTVKQHVKIPVMGSGQLENIEIAADMVARGDIDFIALGRSILKQPNYVEGLIADIKSQSE